MCQFVVYSTQNPVGYRSAKKISVSSCYVSLNQFTPVNSFIKAYSVD